ncbi:MAG: DCC1-like thiol-disulfide oxidoreductase family protein [Pseudomonadota bacterium]
MDSIVTTTGTIIDTPVETLSEIPGGMSGSPILVYDGECNLCNGVVRFILKYEAAPALRFAPSDTMIGESLCSDSGIAGAPDETFLLWRDSVYLERSDAALAVCGYLRVPWRWTEHLRIVPKRLRDGVYRLIARHRYRIFGRRQSCHIPDGHQRARFLV